MGSADTSIASRGKGVLGGLLRRVSGGPKEEVPRTGVIVRDRFSAIGSVPADILQRNLSDDDIRVVDTNTENVSSETFERRISFDNYDGDEEYRSSLYAEEGISIGKYGIAFEKDLIETEADIVKEDRTGLTLESFMEETVMTTDVAITSFIEDEAEVPLAADTYLEDIMPSLEKMPFDIKTECVTETYDFGDIMSFMEETLAAAIEEAVLEAEVLIDDETAYIKDLMSFTEAAVLEECIEFDTEEIEANVLCIDGYAAAAAEQYMDMYLEDIMPSLEKMPFDIKTEYVMETDIESFEEETVMATPTTLLTERLRARRANAQEKRPPEIQADAPVQREMRSLLEKVMNQKKGRSLSEIINGDAAEYVVQEPAEMSFIIRANETAMHEAFASISEGNF